VAFAIVFGCAAYQAGNITGALIGLKSLIPIDSKIIVVLIVIASGALLWFGNYRQIAKILGVIVAVMGLMFLIVAIQLEKDPIAVLKHLVTPEVPGGSSLIILGLIGTTIVPYNLFLGSGISHDQRISSMRVGVIGAVAIGGIITISVLITGSQISGNLSFDRLIATIQSTLGPWSVYLFAAGLFAAGFTSSLTAPLAAAITFQSMSRDSTGSGQSSNNKQYRMVWISVMLIGAFFSLSGIKPIPLIIIAQVVNGFILPFIAIFLILSLSKTIQIQTGSSIGLLNRLLLTGVVFVCILLGLKNLGKVIIDQLSSSSSAWQYIFKVLISGVISLWLFIRISDSGKAS
jgi:Mn2+/Fe2+ NRAMP family transporter